MKTNNEKTTVAEININGNGTLVVPEEHFQKYTLSKIFNLYNLNIHPDPEHKNQITVTFKKVDSLQETALFKREDQPQPKREAVCQKL